MPKKCKECGIKTEDCGDLCRDCQEFSIASGKEYVCGPYPSDDVTNPAYYKDLDPEPIDVIEGWGLGFHLGNVIKYLARHGRKDTGLEGLKKARWYLDRYTAFMEGTTGGEQCNISPLISPAVQKELDELRKLTERKVPDQFLRGTDAKD